MKVLLVSPQSRKEDAERSFMAPALGIIRLAGYLGQRGHDVEAYDPNLHMLTGIGPSIASKISESQWDFIGFSVLEETLIADIENMYLAKKLCPQATLVAGGIEAQFNYQTILDKTPCNIVILSEGEIPLRMLCEGAPLNTIPGIVFKNDAVALNQEEFNEATNSIDWEKNTYEDYWDYYLSKYGDTLTPDNLQEIHTIRVFSRNRCPIGCKFCSSTNQITWATGTNVKVISATEDNLIHTIRRIKEAHPRVKTIYITDDDFCIAHASAIKFCQKVVEEDFGDLTFMCFARAADLTEEMCHWLKRANFRRLNIGIESFSEKVLEEMGKLSDVQKNHDCLAMLKRHGIRAFTNIILITPRTTIKDLEETVEAALVYANDDFYHAGVTLAVKPLKGTEFFERNTDFLSEVEKIPSANQYVKRDDMILAEDPQVRWIQLRYWNTIDDVVSREMRKNNIPHAVQSNLATIKLSYVQQLVEEVKQQTSLNNNGGTDFDNFPTNVSDVKGMPHHERQTVDLPESVGGIAHRSSRKSTHGSF